MQISGPTPTDYLLLVTYWRNGVSSLHCTDKRLWFHCLVDDLALVDTSVSSRMIERMLPMTQYTM
jgi:hypothetical protein